MLPSELAALIEGGTPSCVLADWLGERGLLDDAALAFVRDLDDTLAQVMEESATADAAGEFIAVRVSRPMRNAPTAAGWLWAVRYTTVHQPSQALGWLARRLDAELRVSPDGRQPAVYRVPLANLSGWGVCPSTILLLSLVGGILLLPVIVCAITVTLDQPGAQLAAIDFEIGD